MAAPSKSGGKPKPRKAAKKTTRKKPPAVAAPAAPAAPAVPAIPAAPAAPGPAPEPGASLAARVQHAVERELNAVERILDTLGPASEGEAERAARTLASLARTLREVALTNHGEGAAQANEPDDDPIPRDIDEFRRELARRIHAFVDSHADGAVPGEPAGELERPAGARLA